MSNLALLGAGPEAGTAAPFDPLSFSLFVWVDPSNAASITSSSGAVSQINDLSGNAHHLTAAGVAQPITGTRTIGGKNGFDFDGTNHRMNSTNFTQAQPVTVFVVCQADVVADMQTIGDGTTTPVLFSNLGNWHYYAGIDNDMGVAQDTSPHILSGVFNGASSSAYLDGILKSSADPGANGWAAKNILWGDNLSANRKWNGILGEMIVVASALNPTNRASYTTYLGNKWGITVP